MHKDAVELPLDLDEVGGQFLFPDTLGCIEALDPGGTTGWAFFNPMKLHITCGQLAGEHHCQLYSHLEEHETEANSVVWGSTVSFPNYDYTIICESFEFRQHRGEFNQDKIELDSREYIGVVKLYSQLMHTPVTFQTASLAKGFISDDKLRRLGWYVLTKGMPHARDALRHLIYNLVVDKRITKPFTNRWLMRVK